MKKGHISRPGLTSNTMLTLLLMELAGVALLGGALFRLGKGKHNG